MSEAGLSIFGARSIKQSDDDRIELRSFFLLLWRRKLLILACAVAGLLLAFVLISQVTPRYTAQARVLLDPRTVQVLNSDDVVSDLTLSNSVLDTEVAVLRSNTLIERVIARIDPALLERFDPANREPGAVDRFQNMVSSSLRTVLDAVTFASDEPSETSDAAPLLTPEERRVRRLVGAVKRNMRVWREGQSYLIAVAVTTEQPRLSAELANGITEQYISGQIEQRSSTVRGATDFLSRRVEEMRISVEDAESKIEAFRSSQLEESGVTMATLEQQLLDLTSQLAIARADLASARSRFQRIESVTETEGIEVASELLSSPLVISLREELLALRREDADLATTLGPDHPDRVRLRASIDLLRQDLAEEVRKIVANLRNDAEIAQIRSESIRESLGEIEERLGGMSRDTLELRQLEREADAMRSSYQAVLDRLNETRSVQELQQSDARIIEQAYPPGAPSEPRVMLFTALGGTVGFMVGLILAFFAAVSSAGFRRSSQIEQATGLPVLASLPRGRWRGSRKMLQSLRKEPYQGFAERLRALRTTIRLRADAPSVATIMITSSVPGEGKTTTSLALAHMEGLARRQCIVLDLDTRRSRLARDMRYAPERGDLGSYLAGEDALEDTIHEVPGQNFSLLTVTRPYPNLMENVDKADLENLLAELRKRFDTIIIDTPPVFLVADALAVAQLCDVVLLAVKEGTTRRRAVTEAARSLADVGTRSVGVVLTMIDPREEQDTYGISTEYSYVAK